MSKEILILGKEAFDKLKPDVQRFIKQQSQHIADLMSKLAESEERLKEELVEKKGLERALSVCNRQNDEFADMIKKLVSEKEELKQQLAIEELEKLKDFFLEPYKDEEMDTDYIITKDAGEIADYLLDQIKQLKEMK